METITAEQAASTVTRLLADPEYGPHHVARCQYFHEEEIEGSLKPACIVGHIIHEHAPDSWEKIIEDRAIGKVFDALLRQNLPYHLSVDKELADALLLTQKRQDLGVGGDRGWGVTTQPILDLVKGGA